MDNQIKNFTIDLMLQETLALSEFISTQKKPLINDDSLSDSQSIETEIEEVADYLFDVADSTQIEVHEYPEENEFTLSSIEQKFISKMPESSGILYRIDDGGNTFCVRGLALPNLRMGAIELCQKDSAKRSLYKIQSIEDFQKIKFFTTKNLEIAEAVKEQIVNRRFPKVEDFVCNISDPGFSWWMDVSLALNEARFEIFFKAHSINRAEKYIQLGPIGDGAIASLRFNQAKNLLRSSFPITEFVSTERSITLATSKPDHLGFMAFKNIFLLGENHTTIESFPDNSLGRTLYYYFQELAAIRKFWIEVQKVLVHS